MIDSNLLRDNPDAIKASQRARGNDEAIVDEAVAADATWRKTLQEYESLRAEQNAAAKLVGAASKEERPALIAAVQVLAEKVKAALEIANAAEVRLNEIIWRRELQGFARGWH